MCIIIAKPMGIAMPDAETRERCFRANPDGAGFMFADGKTVRIRKGFMTLESFEEALEEELAGFDTTETAVVMHFRIATSGTVSQATCHPFPISGDAEKMRETRLDSRFGIAHNGVISGRTTYNGWSDTMDFVADVVAPLMRMNPSFMHSSDALELLEGACQSKLAIMDNSGEIATVGKFIEDGGVLYSNDSYLRRVTRWSSYGSMFAGKGYYEAYPQYKETWPASIYDYDDDLTELVDALPFGACAECCQNEECALTHPECETDKMASNMKAWYNGETQSDELVLASYGSYED